MGTDFIVFVLSEQTFAVDLDKFSVILNPNLPNRDLEIIDNKPVLFSYKNRNGQILDLSEIFDLEKKPQDKMTRFLVGESEHQLVGFYVDEIKEFISISLNNELVQPEFSENEFISMALNFDEDKYQIINVDRILSVQQEKGLDKWF